MITGINHVTLAVSDLDASVSFYVNTLGLRLRARWTRGAYLSAGSLWVCLTWQPSKLDRIGRDYSHIALDVDVLDFDALADRIRSTGAILWQENASEGQSLYFLDPDAHKLEIHASSLEARLEACRKQPYDGMIFFDDP